MPERAPLKKKAMTIYRRFEDCSKKEWYKIFIWGVSEEKVIGAVAYPFEWSLYTMCRDYIQKDRGRGDVFIAGCVCGNGEGENVVMVLVLVVDMCMGWVKKKF